MATRRRGNESGQEQRPKTGLTRRGFLEMVGMAGGAAAVYESITALGLINTPEARAETGPYPTDLGKGKRVVILGAGIGGLTAAYRLQKMGYECLILEAQARAGGRNLTARRGTIVVEESKGRRTEQRCDFDDDMYLNLGPGRLPYHHRGILELCRELRVGLEIYVMETEANLFQTDAGFGGKPQIRRRIGNDTRGYIAELLAKAVGRGNLDDLIVKEDRERLIALLGKFGDLDMKICGKRGAVGPHVYNGSTRAGCGRDVTVSQACCPVERLSREDLLLSRFWERQFYQPRDFEWQPTLFQPVGGMDMIVEGFKRSPINDGAGRLGDRIRYQCVVSEVKRVTEKVHVSYRDRATGAEGMVDADYCISNIPLPVLKDIPNNFAADFKAAVGVSRFAPTCKVGWQSNTRFWESNAVQTYGGISYTTHPITQFWYPSNDYYARRGTLTGAYNYRDNAILFGNMSPADRIKLAREGGAKLHEEFHDEEILPSAKALSIAWQNVPFQQGGWADWQPGQRSAYVRLLQPDLGGRFFVVGDQMSELPGWQEGAVMSADHVIREMHAPPTATVASDAAIQVPNVREIAEDQ